MNTSNIHIDFFLQQLRTIDWSQYPPIEPGCGGNDSDIPGLFERLCVVQGEEIQLIGEEISRRIVTGRPSILPYLLPLLFDLLRSPTCSAKEEILYILADAGLQADRLQTTQPDLARNIRTAFLAGYSHYSLFLLHPVPEIRAATVTLLRVARTDEAIRALKDRLHVERDHQVIYRILHQLQRVQIGQEPDLYSRYLHSSDPGVRCQAAIALSNLSPTFANEATSILVSICASGNRYAGIAYSALEGIGAFAVQFAIDSWLNELSSLPAEKMRVFVANVLGLLFTPTSLDLTRDQLSDNQLRLLRGLVTINSLWRTDFSEISPSLRACGLPGTRAKLTALLR